MKEARAACSVFGFAFTSTFLFSFFFFYKFHTHLFHGAYWCMRDPAHIPIFLFHLNLHFSNLCACVSKHVHAFPSSSIFIHIHHHIHMYICFDYCVMIPYNLYALITKLLRFFSIEGVYQRLTSARGARNNEIARHWVRRCQSPHCLPAPKSVARFSYTYDPMFKGLYFSNHPCLRFLWMQTYHVHIKKVKFCVHLKYVRCLATSLFVSFPST